MANVEGKFYRGETQRRGVTPVSPPNAEDDPQDPLNPPGAGNTTTYKQLGDTIDKSFVGKNGYVPVVTDETSLTLQPNIPNTGVAVFGGVVYNSTTTVDIGIVKGYIVDNETDPLVSSVLPIQYSGATGVTVTTVGSGTRSYALLKSDGTIHFQNTYPTSEDRKQMIYLFKVGHPAGAITVVANEPDFVLSPLQQFRDLFQAFNYVNEGVYAYADAANLTFNTSAGLIVGNGINFVPEPDNPNILTVAATTPCTFVYRSQTGAGGGATTLIDPNIWDNAGTIDTVVGGSNRSTIQYIHYSPNLGFVIQPGQVIYDNLVDAIAAIGKEEHVVYENLIRDAILIGVLALTRSTTDLTDTNNARFFRADIFGQLVGSAAGTSVTTLQRAYLNSLIPQIETVSGELVIKNGGALDTDVVFAIRDLLDVDNFTVTGDGDVTANSFIKSGGTSAQYLKADGSVSGVSPYILDQVGATDGQVLTWVTANSRFEPVTPSGGSSKWTDGASVGIYRSTEVGIGGDVAVTNVPLTLKSFVVAGNGTGGTFVKPTVFEVLGENGTSLFYVKDGTSSAGFRPEVFFYAQEVSIGNVTTNFASNGLTIKGSTATSTSQVLRILNSSDVATCDIAASGAIYSAGEGSVFGGPQSQTNKATRGVTVKSTTASSTLSVFNVLPFNNTPIWDLRGNGDFYMNSTIILANGFNIQSGTTTGTKIGTTTTQKLAFWNKTPIIQPTNAITAAAFVANTSGIANDTATFGGYTMGQIAAALINTGILA